MKKIEHILIALVALFALCSCSNDEPVPLQWELTDGDTDKVSVEFTPGFYIQGSIMADADYSGTVTLRCVNYADIFLAANEAKGIVSEGLGLTVERSQPATLKICFSPVHNADAEPLTITITGQNGSATNLSTLSIGRR